ncbi:MAG TPA: ABC transporter substrate-binding protein [Alphaproteobacteria bacterium]|nr:ABC transporter substrate-binding protein [Alphaproteobacteria bacterium]
MNRLFLGAVPAVAALALVLGILISPAAAAGSKPLVIAVGAGPQSMDPLAHDVDSNMSVMDNIFDALLERNTAGQLVPGLATSWERVDANTWRFKLRRGVKFHNGNEFTWEDVKFTFERGKDPKVSEFSNFAQLVASVKPAGNDPWTIDITTTQPVPYFVQALPLFFIMDQKSTASRSEGEVAQHPIGTGPYKFVEWVKSSYLKVTANDAYWGGKPKIENVELRPISEASTRLAAIASGDVDILQDVPVALIKAVERNPKVEVVARPARRSIFLAIANKPGTPTADLRVRRAMYMAINEPEIIAKVMFGHASPAAQVPDPPTVGYSKAIKRLPYDPAKAKALLKEAGYANGFDLTLNGPNDRYVQDAQIEATVAAQLAKVGIRVKVVSEPKAVFFPKVDRHELQSYLIGWFDGSYDFGRTYNQLFHTVDPKGGSGGTNGDSYSNPKLDEMYAATTNIIDPAKREEALQKLNEAAMEQVVVIPLHYQEDDYAIRKDRGIHFTPRADTWIVYKDISFGS